MTRTSKKQGRRRRRLHGRRAPHTSAWRPPKRLNRILDAGEPNYPFSIICQFFPSVQRFSAHLCGQSRALELQARGSGDQANEQDGTLPPVHPMAQW